MNNPDARAMARKHTAQLLKQLRGYGPVSAPEPTVDPPPPSEPMPDTVTEPSPVYMQLLDATLHPPPPTPACPSPPPLQQPTCPRRQPEEKPPERKLTSDYYIPTVGEGLRHASGPLRQLMAQADEMARLIQIFRAYLPPHLHDHAALIRLDQESWEVHTDSAGWATRLRYALHNIRPDLSEHLGIALPKPRIQVKPIAALSQPRRPILTLTQRNAELLETAARNLSDARLSAALRRLAAHAYPASEPADNPPSDT